MGYNITVKSSNGRRVYVGLSGTYLKDGYSFFNTKKEAQTFIDKLFNTKMEAKIVKTI